MATSVVDEEALNLYAAYARTRIEQGDDPYMTAFRRWKVYTEATHGDALASVDAHDAFVSALRFDFAVEHFHAELERHTGVSIRLPDDSAAPNFGACHRAAPVKPCSLSADEVTSISPATIHRLHRQTVPVPYRMAIGEYYTPRGIAQLAVESLSDIDWQTDSLLDPGCGAGVFLYVCAAEKAHHLRHETPETAIERVLATISGIDIDPLAARCASVMYATAIADLLASTNRDEIAPPVQIGDALGVDAVGGPPAADPHRADHLVGNPPWVTWERIDSEYKQSLRTLYSDRIELLSRSGAERRMGHANDDISIPFVWICVDRHLSSGGSAAFVLKRNLLEQPAGRRLRTLRVGNRAFDATHVHDFGTASPFAGVDARTAIVTLNEDEPSFPVTATRWSPSNDPDYRTSQTVRETHEADHSQLKPVGKAAHTPWIPADGAYRATGPCSHPIRHGVKGDADDVFRLDSDTVEAIEHDLIYPYLCSRHITKYGVTGHERRLVPVRKANEDNSDWLADECPDTYAYLDRNRDALAARQSTWHDRGPFYTVFGTGDYTWAEYKVIWCRLGFNPDFAVVSTTEDDRLGEKQVVPGDHFLFIPATDPDVAHFLCALLNSSVYQRTLQTLSSGGKAGLSKSTIARLELPQWAPRDDARRLADASREAHRAVAGAPDADLDSAQSQIDATVEARAADGGRLFPEVGQRTLSSFDRRSDDAY